MMINSQNIIGSRGADLSQSAQRPDMNDPAQAQDRFLKLLVAQMNNQDPMNPLDNAQMTSQIAQINTVTGIQQLNQTMQGLAGQFTAMQLLQGTAMIGRTVLTEGDTLGVTTTGSGEDEKHQYSAAFDLAGSAAHVKVEILDAGGKVVDSVEMGACHGGRHYFTWDGGDYSGDAAQLRFRVVAQNSGETVAASTLSPHAVVAASSAQGRLQLELDDGTWLDYDAIKAVY